MATTAQTTTLTNTFVDTYQEVTDAVIKALEEGTVVFYLLIYYKDNTTGNSQVEPIFFTYSYRKDRQFSWGRVRRPTIDNFINSLKRKNVLVFE